MPKLLVVLDMGSIPFVLIFELPVKSLYYYNTIFSSGEKSNRKLAIMASITMN